MDTARTLPIWLAGTLLFAACGNNKDSEQKTAAEQSDPATAGQATGQTASATAPAAPAPEPAAAASGSRQRPTGLHVLFESLGADSARVEPAAPGGDCKAVAEHMVATYISFYTRMAESTGASPPPADELDKLRAKARPQYENACVHGNWSAKMRDCVLAATNASAYFACEAIAAESAAASGGGADGAAADTDCDKVADHLVTLMTQPGDKAGPAPAGVMEQMRQNMLESCRDWAPAGRRCALGIKKFEDLQTCAMSMQ